MKTWIPIVILAIVVVAAGAGIYLAKHNKISSPTMQSSSNKPTQSGNIFTSIQDAINRSISLKCDYTYQNIHTVAFIKNGQIRSDITSSINPQANGSVIIKVKDKKIYYWNTQNMGFVMTMPDMSMTPSVTPSSAMQQGSATQNTMSNLEQYKQYCMPGAVDDSLFVLPANITFKDMSQMMPSITVPTSGYTAPTGYSVPTQYQQYMPH